MFVSSRGFFNPLLSFLEAVEQGLAPDGGLFIASILPSFSEEDIANLMGKTYEDRAYYILSRCSLDISDAELYSMITQAYSSFYHPKRCPLSPLSENTSLLEQFHGPTASFKDMALQLTPHFFAKAQEESKKNFCVVTATSGDTGIAAVEGFRKQENISVVVLYPKNGVSPIQEHQMQSIDSKNVKVLGVEGDFDFCQTSIKTLFKDERFGKKLLDTYNTKLSAANSMNWGRFLPQIVYYFSAYADLLDSKTISLGESIEVCVPSGNFGNLLGGFLARKTGLPIAHFISASNHNNTLSEFINTGIYDVRDKKLIPSHTPSIDILKASNIERLLYWLTKGSTQTVRGWFEDLEEKGVFQVDKETHSSITELFSAGFATEEQMHSTIKKYFQKDIILDPHTATAVHVSEQFPQKHHRIIASTAHHDKFPQAIEQAMPVPPISHPALKEALRKPKVQTESIQADYGVLCDSIESFLKTL